MRRLGAGSMGVVYEAEDLERGARVALKALKISTADTLYRFKNEFRALQGLEHPNLVSLGELIENRGKWFFTMELVEGMDLLAHVRDPEVLAAAGPAAAERGFDEERLRSALKQIALGLYALHGADKVHRDLKPSNIMVTEEGRVVILDFGLVADLTPEKGSTEHRVVGTAPYMAPEQAASARVGPAADWYAVGVILYEALTGQSLFDGAPLEILLRKQGQEPVSPRVMVPDVPEDLDALCCELQRIDPAARPTGRQVLQRLGLDEHLRPSARSAILATQFAPFVGRQAELATLRSAFESTRQGQAVTVYVRGESGLGKTALIREFTQALSGEDGSAVVLSGRCYERESVPYKAFDGVVDALARHLGRLPDEDANDLLPPNIALLRRIFPVLGRVEAIAQAPRPIAEPSNPHELRNRMFAALRELLARLAARESLVLVIDDLQWAGPDSMLLLGDLMRPPEAPPLLLLLASRPGVERGVEAELLPEMGEVRRVEIEPLAPEDARQLARLLLEGAAAATSLTPNAVVDEARGHPLYMGELVRHAVFARHDGPSRPRLDEAIWARVSQLPAPAGLLMQLIAVAGAPFPHAVVRRAAKMEPEEYARQVSLLRAAHLVRGTGWRSSDDIETYHDRVRESVLANLDDEIRKERDSRLAIALESEPEAAARPELLLRHLEAAGKTERAARYAVEAAKRASEALAFDRAAVLYRAALRLGEDRDPQKLELQIALADALANVGRGSRAASVYLEVAERAGPATRRMCLQRAAEQALATGHIERGVQTLAELLAATDVALPRTPRRALMLLLWNRLKLRLRGFRWKERDESEIASADLDRLDAYQIVSEGLGLADTIRGADFQARRTLLALRAGEAKRVARSLAMEGAYRAAQGGRALASARELVERARRITDRVRDPDLDGFVTFTEGGISYFAGQFKVSVERFAAAEAIFLELSGATWGLNNARLFQLVSLRYMGAFEQRQRLFDVYVRDAARRGDLYAETSIRRAVNAVWLARGLPEAARSDLSRTSWSPPEGGFHLQHWYEIQAWSELALYEGKVAARFDELRPSFDLLARSLLPRVQIVRVLSQWLLGRMLLAVGHRAGSDRRRALAEAARIARRLVRKERIGYATVFGHLIEAAVQAQSGDRTAGVENAVAALRRAEVAATSNAMQHLAIAARRRIGELLGGDEGTRLVTEADAWAEEEGIVEPNRMIEVVAPGFQGE